MKNIKTLFATLILAFGIIFYAQAQTFLTNGLLAYYPFNGSANDASGNGNNATLAGNYQFVANGLGKMAFEANGDASLYYSGGGHVLLPTFSTNLNSGFTLSVWAENEMPAAAPSAEEDYISFGTLDTGAGWISLNAGTPSVNYVIQIGSGPSQAYYFMPISLQSYLNSGWKHLVLAYKPGSFACYFNGQNVFQTNVTFNLFPVAQAAINRHWWDNGSSSSARMSATYQNVRIYNRALSDSEVSQLYAIENGPLIGLQKFVQPTLSNLLLNTNYQMQVSGDLITWTNQGSVFTATNNNMTFPQLFNVNNWNSLFFRLQVAP